MNPPVYNLNTLDLRGVSVESVLDSGDIGIAQVGKLNGVVALRDGVALIELAGDDGRNSHTGAWNT
jgi:hypothetical protein